MRLVRNLELEAAIVDHPDDYERFAVYGDWLAQRGDPRGALMVAGSELARLDPKTAGARPRITELRRVVDGLWREHGAAIAGPLAGLSHHGLTLEWNMGCVVGAALTIVPDDAGSATLAHLLAHPAAFAVSKLELGTQSLGEHGFSYQPLVDLVSEDAPTTLRELALGDMDGWTADETVVLGDLRPLFARHSRLQRVTLAGRASTVSAPWALPELRELALRPVGLSRTWLRVVNAEPWPALRKLTFSYASALDSDISWLTASRMPGRFPHLTRLAVIGSGDALGVIEALGATGLSRQIIELDVTYGRFGDAAIARLNEDRDDFPSLERLIVGQLPPGVARDTLSWLDLRAR